ncbi:MAG: glucose-6-phosphate isomerase [Candidatus Bipolaricaulota bacterium]
MEDGKHATQSFRDVLCALERDNVIARLWAGDHRLWSPIPNEIVDRLGWLRLPDTMATHLAELSDFSDEARSEGLDDVVLLGMGGSSLAPDAMARAGLPDRGAPRLHVLDTLHPSAVRRVSASIDLQRTLFVVSTKSGTTSETLTLARYFQEQADGVLGPRDAGRRFVAITDPGSPLVAWAAARGYRRTFLNDPNVGGRYAALSLVGLVPGALLRIDLEALLHAARGAAAACSPDLSPQDNRGAWLGASLAAQAMGGRDKLTIEAPPDLAGLADWIEQLIAESTGKSGRGILPVVGEPLAPASAYGRDRLFLSLSPLEERRSEDLALGGHPALTLDDRDAPEFGRIFFLAEFATAIAGHVLGIHPFNQPDVESAKTETRRLLEELRRSGRRPAETRRALTREELDRQVASAKVGDYVALLAFLDPSPAVEARLRALQGQLRDATGCAVTLGFGPRYLHSTGQLHKGDAGRGIFVHLVDATEDPLDAPGPSGRERLADALLCQAFGDAATLRARGRRVESYDLGGDPAAALDEVLASYARRPPRQEAR